MSDARQYFKLPTPFAMKRGGTLHAAHVAYETWGTLNTARDNAVLILTGLSPSAHAASRATVSLIFENSIVDLASCEIWRAISLLRKGRHVLWSYLPATP